LFPDGRFVLGSPVRQRRDRRSLHDERLGPGREPKGLVGARPYSTLKRKRPAWKNGNGARSVRSGSIESTVTKRFAGQGVPNEPASFQLDPTDSSATADMGEEQPRKQAADRDRRP